MCVRMLSCVWLFVTPWSVACQAPLSMEFPRREYWSGLLFPFSRDLPPTQGSNPRLLHLLHWQVDSLPLAQPGKPCVTWDLTKIQISTYGISKRIKRMAGDLFPLWKPGKSVIYLSTFKKFFLNIEEKCQCQSYLFLETASENYGHMERPSKRQQLKLTWPLYPGTKLNPWDKSFGWSRKE